MSEKKVKLIIDAKGETGGIMQFVAGLKQLKAQAKEGDQAFGGFMSKIKAWQGAILSAVSLGALTKLTNDAIDSADAMSKQAQSAGMAVDAFSALSYAGKLSNASSEDLIGASKELSKWLEKTGQSGRDLTEVLLEQADLIARMPDGPNKVRVAIERFGDAGQKLIPLLNQGSEAIRRQMEEAKEFGVVIGPRFSANAQIFNDNLTRFGALFRGTASVLMDALLPEMIRFQKSVIDFIKTNPVHIAAIDSLIQVYQGFAVAAATASAGMDMLGGSVGRFFGNLSVTGSVSAAAKASSSVLEDATKDWEAKVDRILAIGRRVDRARNESGVGPVDTKAMFLNARQAADDELKALDIRLRKLQTRGAQGIRVSTGDGNELRGRGIVIGTIQQENESIKALLEEQKRLVTEQMDARLRAGLVSDSNPGLLSTPEARQMELQDAQKLFQIQKELLDLKERTNDFTFFEKLSRNLQDLSDQVVSLGAVMADVLTGGIKSAIDTVANGIWAVIDGTATWGSLFLQVGRQIISQLIAIALQETIVAGLKKGLAMAWKAFTTTMRAADVVESNATEVAKTPALAANATLASIGSWGIAVAIGIAAIAAILASVGAFESGGVVAGGEQLIRVNENGTESVLNARATSVLGAERIAALNAGDFAALDLESRMARNLDPMVGYVRPMSPSASPGAGSASEVKLAIVLVDSRNSQAGLEAIMSAEGRGRIIEIVKDARIEVGIPTTAT